MLFLYNTLGPSFLSENCLETCYKVFHIVDLFNVNEAKGIDVSLESSYSP